MKFLVIILSFISNAAFADPNLVNDSGLQGLVSGMTYAGDANGAPNQGGLIPARDGSFCNCSDSAIQGVSQLTSQRVPTPEQMNEAPAAAGK